MIKEILQNIFGCIALGFVVLAYIGVFLEIKNYGKD